MIWNSLLEHFAIRKVIQAFKTYSPPGYQMRKIAHWELPQIPIFFTAICGRMQSLRAYIQRIDMTDIISQLQFSATITGPICLMLGLGCFLNGLTWSMRILLKSRRGLFFRSLFQRCFFEHRQFKARFFLKHFLSGIQLNCQYAVFSLHSL